MIYKYIIFILLNCSLIFSFPLDEDEIEFFYIARYGGDTASVYQYLSDEFIYEHAPYIGLGIEVYYVDESLIITNIINDSLQTILNKGDRIYEHNGKIVDSLGLITYGHIGEEQKLIITKQGDSTFQEVTLKLQKYQYTQSIDSFLESISNYSNIWYEYDIIIQEIISKKNRIIVHYSWEGSKSPKGNIYTFSAIEILHINKKTKLIERVKGFWSEKQFRDQFK